jgi:aminoglycoside phosphotransferase (APT) family kinase protein
MDQHPALAGRELRQLACGWDNESYRLGDDLVVRLPRRAVAGDLIKHEQRWLAHLQPRLPLPIPVPVRTGQPGRGYPWSWSIVPWLTGAPWESSLAGDPQQAANDLAGFLAALHRPSPPDAPFNPWRGIPLARRAERFHGHLSDLGDRVDGDRCRRTFRDLAGAPAWSNAPVWVHGDLHPLNILVTNGRVTAVLDFGDVCGGDPAIDLAAAWMVFPAEARRTFRSAYAATDEVDDATWIRARGWALVLAIAYIAGSKDDPIIGEVGRRTLAAVLSDG